MPRKSKSKARPEPEPNREPIGGIPAAAIEGAQKADPNPGPGLPDSPKIRRSAVSQSQEDIGLEDEEQEWRRAGGGGPDDPGDHR